MHKRSSVAILSHQRPRSERGKAPGAPPTISLLCTMECLLFDGTGHQGGAQVMLRQRNLRMLIMTYCPFWWLHSCWSQQCDQGHARKDWGSQSQGVQNA